jgi:PAS domain-containing protein
MAILRLEEGLVLEEMNAAGAEILGLPSEGLRDLPLRDVLPGAPEELERLAEAAARTGLPERLESGFGHPERLFGVTLFPLRDRRVGAVFADITERRRLEERVEAQRANLRGFMDTAEDYFFVLDRDGTIRDTNRTAWSPWGTGRGSSSAGISSPSATPSEGRRRGGGSWSGTRGCPWPARSR